MLSVKTPEEVFLIIKQEFEMLESVKEFVSIEEANGRILAEDLCATEYVPSFNRSTVDGFAVYAADTFGCSDSIPAILENTKEILMGAEADFKLQKGFCAPIPTGGQLPEGADAVQMIEYSEDYGDGTTGILKPVAPGNNVILKGDDVYPGKKVLLSGRKLNAQDIGALAALGIVSVPVKKKLKVAILSTGDELVPPTEAPKPGQVRDVNSALLTALIAQSGAIPVSFGIIPDQEALLDAAVKKASAECDIVLISGGSSVGAKDATCRIIESQGEILFHGIAMKPGKPTIFGKITDKPVIGLPGHPVAAFFITHLFIRPLMAKLTGQTLRKFQATAILAESVEANHGRAQYNGVFLEKQEGKLIAHPIRGKSGLITTLAGSDGYICIPRDCEGLPAGASVQVTLYSVD
ncbi:MAG: molybdopterin molybdotransferase MoeA [Lachnospiraceae bacterium]|nr:molybdopterin molybdotransferase MoeA [Lachnospiraceae bacterium]